jgi:glycosyltransferase involved in cell wall biosynthesis
MEGIDLAVVHHLPRGGGAWNVLVNFLARTGAGRVTVYTGPEPEPGEPALASLPDGIVVERLLTRTPGGRAGRAVEMLGLARRGRQMAARVDAGGHDVAFVFPSMLIGHHEVLPWLSATPSLCYSAEPLRSAYEPAAGAAGTLEATLHRPYDRLRARHDRRNVAGADRAVTHSRFVAGRLAEIYGVDAAVVRLGVDAHVFAPGTAQRKRSVLSVGALHPFKGHEFVVAALATIPAEGRPPLTVIADRGDTGPALRRLARERGVDLDVRERVSTAELVEAYRSAGVVACGQVREPFGLVPLEAWACGAPVVAVREGGFAESVRDGETGLLTERDPRAFAGAIERVVGEPALAADLGRRGLEDARARWTWEATTRGFDALLADTAARARGGAAA